MGGDTIVENRIGPNPRSQNFELLRDESWYCCNCVAVYVDQSIYRGDPFACVYRWLSITSGQFRSFRCLAFKLCECNTKHPDSKVHGVNIGPNWVLSGPDVPHVGPMNLAIRAPTVFVFRPVHFHWLILQHNLIHKSQHVEAYCNDRSWCIRLFPTKTYVFYSNI